MTCAAFGEVACLHPPVASPHRFHRLWLFSYALRRPWKRRTAHTRHTAQLHLRRAAMIQGFKGVKYGLTVPASKKKAAPATKPANALAAFGDDSDGEHEAVPQQLARQAASKKTNSKVGIWRCWPPLRTAIHRCCPATRDQSVRPVFEPPWRRRAPLLLGACPQVTEVHAAALEQDASVFDYDGVYDSMQEAKAAPVRAARAERSSKYIEGLLDKAKERQREQDIIFERR